MNEEQMEVTCMETWNNILFVGTKNGLYELGDFGLVRVSLEDAEDVL